MEPVLRPEVDVAAVKHVMSLLQVAEVASCHWKAKYGPAHPYKSGPKVIIPASVALFACMAELEAHCIAQLESSPYFSLPPQWRPFTRTVLKAWKYFKKWLCDSSAKRALLLGIALSAVMCPKFQAENLLCPLSTASRRWLSHLVSNCNAPLALTYAQKVRESRRDDDFYPWLHHRAGLHSMETIRFPVELFTVTYAVSLWGPPQTQSVSKHFFLCSLSVHNQALSSRWPLTRQAHMQYCCRQRREHFWQHCLLPAQSIRFGWLGSVIGVLRSTSNTSPLFMYCAIAFLIFFLALGFAAALRTWRFWLVSV